MSIKVLATIGPSSLNKDTIQELASKKVNLFRINLSHTKLDDVSNIIDDINSWTDVPICIDSEGAQVRNQDMKNESVEFKKGSTVKVHHKPIVGDNSNISLYPEKVSKQLVIDTAKGSLEIVKQKNNIRGLINSVASKGGTTAEALKVLEKKNSGLYEILKKAIIAANKRAIQLSKN